MHRQAHEVLLALFATLGIDAPHERPWLFGHSDGGSIALLYAARWPPQLSGVVVMAPHILVESLSIASIEKARDAYRDTDLKTCLARHHDDPDSAFRGWNDISRPLAPSGSTRGGDRCGPPAAEKRLDHHRAAVRTKHRALQFQQLASGVRHRRDCRAAVVKRGIGASDVLDYIEFPVSKKSNPRPHRFRVRCAVGAVRALRPVRSKRGILVRCGSQLAFGQSC